MKNNPTYTSWVEMRRRCNSVSCKSYSNYGGRGISVCSEWSSYQKFLEDMGPRPLGKTLDRIRVNEGYYKGNCRWSTNTEQLRNTRVNRLIEFDGEVKCLVEWAELYGLSPSTVSLRLSKGWSIEAALTEKLNLRRKGVAHNVKLVAYKGESKTLKAWAADYQLKYSTLHKRIFTYNMTIEQALNRKVKGAV